jgi:hypothetical protein
MAVGCNELTRGINPSCQAIKKPGGLNKTLLVGLLDDLEGVTFGSGNLVTGFSFAADKGFVKFIGKREKHNSTMGLEVAENFNLRTQGINLVCYYLDPEELEAIDKLIDAEGVFVVAQTNSGELEVWGLNKGPNFKDFGLKAASIDGGSGTAITDPNVYTLGLSGSLENLQLYFEANSENTLAQNLAALEADVVWPVVPPETP